MNLESALELVAELTPPRQAASGVRAQTDDGSPSPATEIGAPVPSFALGVEESAKRDWKVAVRVQDEAYVESARLKAVIEATKGEVNVELVGPVVAMGLRDRSRPVRPGLSCSHPMITAGTLGAFVTRDGEVLALSNNHVLAATNQAKIGDPIVQPGIADGGSADDQIGTLAAYVPLNFGAPNDVDCAVCQLDTGIDWDPIIPGLGQPSGLASPMEASEVAKVGRTTGETRGQIRGFNFNNLVVQFPNGRIRFDGQVEIAASQGAFSEGGDSGSLIVTNESSPRAVGLLFAGASAFGEASPSTFANPIAPVLAKLNCHLC